MKRKWFFILSIAIMLGCCPKAVMAQSAQYATAKYNEFVQQIMSDNKVAAYNILYESYKSNINVLKSAQKNSADYQQVKGNLLKMWPHLENATIFYASKGYQTNATFMAQAYIEMPLMDEFKGTDFNYSAKRGELSYFVASRYFNNHDYKKAIPFLSEYLKTGDEKYRRNVFLCMIDACIKTNEVQLARSVLDDAIRNYPNDFHFISKGIDLCQQIKDNQGLQYYLDKALAIKPYDQTILNMQGKIYEDAKQYDKALEVYNKLLRNNPKSLEINKHLALNYYNLGALNTNKSITETDSKEKKRLQRQGDEYFALAVPILEEVILSEPSSLKYNTALAVAYSRLGNSGKLENQNRKLASIGGGRVSENSIPQLMSSAGNSASSFDAITQSNTSSSVGTSPVAVDEIPTFSSFAKKYIEERIKQWQAKDPYETANEYRQRVTEDKRTTKVKELQKQAETDYIQSYSSELTMDAFTLKPYDAENEVFLIDSKMGQLVVPVPRANSEAKLFEQSWNGIALKDAKYYIADDKLAIAELTFVTPTGMDYKYSNAHALTYTETKVDVQFDDIDYSSLAANSRPAANNVKVQSQEVKVGLSDVDINIPENKTNNDNTFAIIVANENYNMVTKVPMAINDGTMFSKYCEKTLGLPKQNIRYFQDASYGMMLNAIKHLRDIAAAYQNEEFHVIFYYAGHGIPDEATKDGFLLPTDADGQQTEVCYSLNKLYGELSSLNAKSVLVFLDACFSGAEREGGMLASARGIALKAKEEKPKGNMVVFSAATGDETAYPYKEKHHGLFTYYLLKKLQETKGNVTLEALSDYITSNVKKQSVVINHKSQTPTVSPSPLVIDKWKEWKLRK